MKKLIALLLLPLALFGATPAPINVQKSGDGLNQLVGNLDVPSGGTLTIDSGGTLTLAAGSTMNFPAAFIPWVDVNKTGSSLADLATRSASDLSSGTVATARLYTTAVGYNITGGANLDAIAGLTPAASQFLQRNAGNTAFQWATISPVITLGSDLTGNVTLTNLTSGTLNGTVAKVNGVAYGTSPTTGFVPVVTGANTVTYELVPNTSLANSSITIGGASTALGGTVTASTILDSVGSTRGSVLERGVAGWAAITPGTSTYVLTSNGAGADPSYQQVSLTAASITGVLLGVNGGTGVNNTGKTITLGGNLTTSGAFATTLTVGGTTTVTLPATGTLVGSADTGTVTNTMLAGSIANAKLTNSTVTIGSTSVALGATASTVAGLTLTTPVIATGLTASGAAANDFSASTGTFLTSTGANTLNGAVTINAAATPSLTTASGKTNTGFLQVNGKTSGSLEITTADATAQAVIVSLAAQTVGGATLTIPNVASVSDTFSFITLAQTLANKTLTAPVINGATSSGSTSLNFSGNSGTFLTSTGANTLGGATTIADATTPSLTTATGKTNTGFVLIQGKTSGGFKLLTADATAQTVTLNLAAQTVGAATLTIPDQAGTSRNLVTDTGTQTLTGKTLSTTNTISAALTWTAGVRQTFGPNATTPGLNVGSNAGDPSTPSNGDVWYDSTGNLLRARVNGASLTIGAAGGTVTHTVGALTVNQIVLGNNGADVQALGSLGTITTVLHGNAGGAPSFGAVVLTTDVSGTLPVGNGGTGITALGAGVATWLGTPSSANLLAAVTGSTGSGALFFAGGNFGAATGTSAALTTKLSVNATATTQFPIYLVPQVTPSGSFGAGIYLSAGTAYGSNGDQGSSIIMQPTFATTNGGLTGLIGFNLNLANPSVTGTSGLATSYQIYISSAATATAPWGIYQAGTDNNYLAGKLALGSTAADASTRLWLGGSTTTVSGFAQGERITTTQTAAVNADALSGLVTVPTYATGTFTGLVASGVWARTPSNTGTGTINLNYGVRADAVSAATYAVGLASSSQTAGTTGNTDVLVGTQTAATGNWGIYQGDTYANRLGGSLEVDANIATSGVPGANVALTIGSTESGAGSSGINVSPTLTASAASQNFYGTIQSPTFATTNSSYASLSGNNLYLNTPTVTGTSGLAQSIQLYIAQGATATARYGIYQAGTDANVFGGSIAPPQLAGIIGTTTNNNANAGSVGEVISSVLTAGSSVSLVNTTTKTVTSVSLTAGDWDVWGTVDIVNSATTASLTQYGISATNNTLGTQDQTGTLATSYSGNSNTLTYSTPIVRLSLSGTTTYYLVATGYFSAGTENAYGSIYARRMR